MSAATSLKTVTDAGQSLLSDQLETNLFSFFQWGFLGIRGFFDVHIPASSGIYGGQYYRLRMASDPNYSEGQVFEGFRKDWVWESGVENAHQPIHVSGVYVNGNFNPVTATGTYAHHFDFPQGRVVFDTPLPTNSVVTAEYSYRLYQLYTADAPWWQQFQTDSFRVDDPQFLAQESGAWDMISANRIQLPAVVIEAVPRTNRYGFEIGNSTAVITQDVRFHIIGEDRPNVKFLHDAITMQWQKRVNSFDRNTVFANNAFPLNGDGTPVVSGLMYPQLIATYPWRQIRLMQMKSQEMPRLNNLWYTLVTVGCEVDVA